jgi:hypothetical protein
MYQLVSEDEYGTRTIIASNEDVSIVVEKGKKEVSETNLDNALVEEEQKRDFESYFVVFFDEEGNETDKVIYAGKKGVSTRMVNVFDDSGNVHELDLASVSGLKPKFYIGEVKKDKKGKVVEKLYVSDYKGKEIDNFNSEFLQAKTVYFIKK